MPIRYEHISESWVAIPNNPKGVIEFYGGEFFGALPTISYEHMLETLYDAGYAIIAVPVEIGFDHYRIAYMLLRERDNVTAALPQLNNLPHYWLGHSVGCKFIGLLEALTDPETNTFTLPPGYEDLPVRRGIFNEPSILIAPDISDTAAAIRLPFLPNLLDKLGMGIRPTRRQTQQIIEGDELFNLTAIISFSHDSVAGNVSESPDSSDVAWIIQCLRARQGAFLIHREIDGDHMQPAGASWGNRLYRLDLPTIIESESLPRPLEPLILEFIEQLNQRLAFGMSVPASATLA